MSRFLAFGRWLGAIVLFALLLVTGLCVAEADDCNPGFGMCNHHNSNPEVLTHPLLFIVYWGPEWGNGGSSGFSFNTPSGQVVTASEYVNYLEGFIEAISPSGVARRRLISILRRSTVRTILPPFFLVTGLTPASLP